MAAVLLAGVVVAAGACDNETPTDPSTPAVNVTGTWRGDITVGGATAQMTWTLTQTNGGVTGPVRVGLPTGTVLLNGNLTGTMSGTTMTYTIVVPPGGIPTQESCSGQIGGTSTLVSTSTMNGSYNVTSSTCTTGLTSGTFTLTR